MTDTTVANARVYTNFQGLKELQYDKDSVAAKKEVSKQFESILMQMVLNSMRSANKTFSAGLLSSDQMDFYMDMFDKQLSLQMSDTGVGFASMIEKNIDQMQSSPPSSHSGPVIIPAEKKAEDIFLKNENTHDASFHSPEDFVKTLWSSAKTAAKVIGASPEVLLAQAALETNWGKQVIADGKNSSRNLFNIKAGKEWEKPTVAVDSLEQSEGVIRKEKSHFRSYESYRESFMDYAHLLTKNDRYSKCLENAHNPAQFIKSLQHAGYATDANYAEKVMHIFKSPHFQHLISGMKDLSF